ncbi:MAG: hypothetical protein ACKOOL_06600 [Novosphingobium sp.]
MNPVAQLMAPLALLFPAAVAVDQQRQVEPARLPAAEPAEQVSIEQRVTIRINPRPAPMPNIANFASANADTGEPRLVERKAGKCLQLGAIAGVQPLDSDRLLLILRDNRLFTAKLNKGCQAREFYSGFIVKRNADGQVCVSRDELLSRSGSSCQVSGFRQLVEAGD